MAAYIGPSVWVYHFLRKKRNDLVTYFVACGNECICFVIGLLVMEGEKMGNIRCLDPHVADLIAAGEVVERPGAVAKELLENAIDAGATAVTVEIERGGMRLIRVIDNGSGIAEEDAKTAFLRHATSKIRTENDLEAIGTLGFRGEALAAIAAVSRVELRTRTEQAETGCFLQIEGGVAGEVVPVGVPKGTTILVRDLFYNTPARQKFIKKDSAEGMYTYSLVQKIALSHPEISFCFIRDGKEEMRTPGDGTLSSAIYSVLGRDMALSLCKVSAIWEDCTVNGFVSRPSYCRGTRSQQHFFVNGRFVKSRLMMAALEEAYKNQSMTGKFPACVLHITVEPSTVDVNVHPTKTEVKFVKERRLFDAVYHSILNALEEQKEHPKMLFDESLHREKEMPSARSNGMDLRKKQNEAISSFVQPIKKPFAQHLMFQKGQEDWGWVADDLQIPYHHGSPRFSPSSLEEDKEAIQLSFVQEKQQEEILPMPSVSEPIHKEERTDTGKQTEELAVPFHLVGEVFDTYLIVTVGQRMLLIDKHAAHERMQFDRLKKEAYRAMSQTLLNPVVITIKEEAGGILLQHLDLLSEFGFEVETFGENSLIVRNIPFDLEPGQTEDTLLAIAETLLHGRRADPLGVRDQILRTVACKLAIKGGQKNTLEELMVVAKAVVEGKVSYCPHGRPVAIEITKQQLEKQLKRS